MVDRAGPPQRAGSSVSRAMRAGIKVRRMRWSIDTTRTTAARAVAVERRATRRMKAAGA